MIVCKELNKEFATKEEMFKALKDSKKDLIGFKKAQIYKSKDKGVSVRSNKIDVSKLSESVKEEFKDDSYHYVAVNTTNILDSHGDLHVKGIWNKTAKEQNRKNALVDSHEMSLKTTIVRRKNVEMFVTEIPFSMIGKDYDGNTQALIYKFKKDDVRDEYKEFLKDGGDIEASVRMQYVNIELAMNSDNEDDTKEKAVFDNNIEDIANKNELEDLNYFWVVKEAKNIGESSLVLQGSNHATGQVQIEPLKDTQKQKEAVKDNTSINYLLT